MSTHLTPRIATFILPVAEPRIATFILPVADPRSPPSFFLSQEPRIATFILPVADPRIATFFLSQNLMHSTQQPYPRHSPDA
jgi:hypothetical protein